MDSVALGVVVFFTGVGLAASSPGIAYMLLDRGWSVRSAIRVSTITAGVSLLIAISPLIALLVWLAGLGGSYMVLGLLVFFAAQYLVYPYIVLRGLSLRRPGPGEEWLLDILNGLKARAGYSRRIELYIARDDAPNAFAVGNIFKRAIVVNEGLLKLLDRDEVEAVIGHELGHIVNRDTSYLMATSLAPAASYILGVVLVLTGYLFVESVLLYAQQQRRREDAWGALAGVSIGVALVVAGLVLAAAAALAQIAILGFSRLREHLADISSARLTGSDKIASALAKIEEAVKPVRERHGERNRYPEVRLRNMLYIVPMLYAQGYRAVLGLRPEPSKWLAPFSTHPPLEARVYVVEKYLEELMEGAQATRRH